MGDDEIEDGRAKKGSNLPQVEIAGLGIVAISGCCPAIVLISDLLVNFPFLIDQ